MTMLMTTTSAWGGSRAKAMELCAGLVEGGMQQHSLLTCLSVNICCICANGATLEEERMFF